jgi:hypothetical protein
MKLTWKICVSLEAFRANECTKILDNEACQNWVKTDVSENCSVSIIMVDVWKTMSP